MCEYIQSSFFFTQLHATQFTSFKSGSQRNYQPHVTLRSHTDISYRTVSLKGHALLLSL